MACKWCYKYPNGLSFQEILQLLALSHVMLSPSFFFLGSLVTLKIKPLVWTFFPGTQRGMWNIFSAGSCPNKERSGMLRISRPFIKPLGSLLCCQEASHLPALSLGVLSPFLFFPRSPGCFANIQMALGSVPSTLPADSGEKYKAKVPPGNQIV